MRLPLPFRPDHLNAYALDDGDGWTLVDTGLDTPAVRGAWAALLAGPLGGRPVRRVILTHHHPDHVGLAGWFQATGADALGDPHRLADGADADARRAAAAERRDAGLLARRGHGRRRCWPRGPRRGRSTSPTWWRRCRSASAASPRARRSLAGGRRWRVEIGHGHAPEQATLWGVGHDLVLVGDQILPGITPNLGVYATEPDADPVGDWLASLRAAGGAGRANATWRCPATGGRSAACRRGSSELIRHQEAALAALAAHLATPRRASRVLRAALRPADRRGGVRAGARRGGGPSQPPDARRRGGAAAGGRMAPGSGRRGEMGPDSAARSG